MRFIFDNLALGRLAQGLREITGGPDGRRGGIYLSFLGRRALAAAGKSYLYGIGAS